VSGRRAPPTWPAAAARLAKRVNRRRRLGHLLSGAGTGLLAAGLPLLLLRVWQPARFDLGLALGLSALGAALGLSFGLGKAKEEHQTTEGEAAWALDRMATAGERGLTAATVMGPRGAEAAFARPTLQAPEAPRLLPPRGLLAIGAGLLVALVHVLLPTTPRDATAATAGGMVRMPPGTVSMGTAEADAERTTAQRAERAAAVSAEMLEALGLAPDDALLPRDLQARLEDPVRKAAAEAAASADPELAAALAAGTADPDTLARALLDARAAEAEATRIRRSLSANNALGQAAPLAAQRRALVRRYFQRRWQGPAERGPR
jgi:hypothetical protein